MGFSQYFSGFVAFSGFVLFSGCVALNGFVTGLLQWFVACFLSCWIRSA